MKKSSKIAILGCGYVADYYLATIEAYPDLKIVGVFDKNPERLALFCKHYNLKAYSSIEEMLDDTSTEIVLNLTDPRSHFSLSMRCLKANKNVYSEKPLAMDVSDAKQLVDFAKDKNLHLSSAPCSVLGNAARALSYAVKHHRCGAVKLVYAELDDGMVHKMAYKKWMSATGAPWPYRDEFEVGCTLEHSGYYLTWLMEMFGPVKSVTAFSDCVIPEKLGDEAPLNPANTADVSIGILKFESGVVARLTTTIVASHDHSMRVFGDKGVLYLKEGWNNDEAVYLRKLLRIRRKTFLSPIKKRITVPNKNKAYKVNSGHTKMDFLLGVQDIADAIHHGKDNILNAKFSLHVTEVALALQYAGTNSGTHIIENKF